MEVRCATVDATRRQCSECPLSPGGGGRGLVQHVLRSPERIPALGSTRKGPCAAPASVKRCTISRLLQLVGLPPSIVGPSLSRDERNPPLMPRGSHGAIVGRRKPPLPL